MRYPVVVFEDAEDYVAKRRTGAIPEDEPPKIQFRDSEDGTVGDAEEQIWDAMVALQDRFAELHPTVSTAKRDSLEGELVPLLFDAISALPASVLTDRDFHRYLSTRWLFEFAVWRDRQYGKEGNFPSPDSFGASGRALHQDTVSLRMLNRALISQAASDHGGDPFDLARHGAGDVWKSHILRTLTSEAPLVVREVVERVRRDELKTDVVRVFAPRVKRMRANVLLEVLSPEDADNFVAHQRELAVDELERLSKSG